ncbi:MAG: hypothetical protein WB341_13720, partial [Terracidiphilus sp.]
MDYHSPEKPTSVSGSEQRGNEVRFRLLYSGRLLGASRNDARAALKHHIRMDFHPQLKRLWATQPPLKVLAQERAYWWGQSHPEIMPRLPSRSSPFDESEPANPEELEGWGLQEIAENWQRCGRKFIPLVTAEMCLNCSLDILFLRPETPGRLVQHGD